MNYTCAISTLLLTMAMPQVTEVQPPAPAADGQSPERKLVEQPFGQDGNPAGNERTPTQRVEQPEIRVYQLRFANVESLTSTFKQLFRDDIAIASDSDKKQLLVRATPSSLAELDVLVKQLDQEFSDGSEAVNRNYNDQGVRFGYGQMTAAAESNSPRTNFSNNADVNKSLRKDGGAIAPEDDAKIAALRNAYEASEQRAREIAAEGRTANPRENKKVGHELQAEVLRCFQIRQRLHLAELNAMQKKLQRACETIVVRNRIMEQIVDRRVDDLLNPNLRWDDSTPASAAGRDKERVNALQLKPKDELAAYRGFLWESLRPLQHQRNNLLSAIAEIEQSIAALQQPIEIPDELESEAKEKLAREQNRSSQKTKELVAGVKSIRTELASVGAQIALLKKKLAETPEVGKGGVVALEGKILAVDEGRVEVSIGSDDGFRVGLMLQVFRGETRVGDIEIVKIQPDKAIARVMTTRKNNTMERGDRAVLVIDSQSAMIIGQEPGEPIYNDRLKRFKFRFEHIDVTSVAEIAQMFWLQYSGRGNPRITGVWGDPRTNSLVVIGPPEADQAIRDTMAEWEGQTLGIEIENDDSLETQKERLERQRRHVLERLAACRLNIIEAAAAGEKPDSERLKKLNSELEIEEGELETTEQKLEVITETVERLRGDDSQR